MFDGHGFRLDDLAHIQRDQFLYYLEQEHAVSDPWDWPQFREGLVAALTAAFGLESPGRAGVNGERNGAAVQHRIRAVLDDVRSRHDAAADWDGFVDALWNVRRRLRDDLGR